MMRNANAESSKKIQLNDKELNFDWKPAEMVYVVDDKKKEILPDKESATDRTVNPFEIGEVKAGGHIAYYNENGDVVKRVEVRYKEQPDGTKKPVKGRVFVKDKTGKIIVKERQPKENNKEMNK